MIFFAYKISSISLIVLSVKLFSNSLTFLQNSFLSTPLYGEGNFIKALNRGINELSNSSTDRQYIFIADIIIADSNSKSKILSSPLFTVEKILTISEIRIGKLTYDFSIILLILILR